MENVRPFTVWLEADQKKALRELAYKSNRYMAELIRESIEEYLKRTAPPQPENKSK